jgi:hypothetical protein
MCAWFDRGIIMYGDMFCPFHLIMLKPISWLAFPDAMCEAESTISNEYLFIEEQVFSFIQNIDSCTFSYKLRGATFEVTKEQLFLMEDM